MSYNHLDQNERELINFMFYKEKYGINKIAKYLNRNKSTISREIKRNTIDGYYEPISAHNKYLSRRWYKNFLYLDKYKTFTELFNKYFNKYYHGIEATIDRIRKMNLDINIPSVQQVYNWIKSRRWTIQPWNKLRRSYRKGKRRKIGIFSKFKDKRVLPIWTRPKNIDNRSEFGHWEADLIIGKRSNNFDNLLTFTERLTRMNFIVRVKTKNSMKINSILYKLIKENNLNVKSITIDNGIEFEKIGLLAHWVDCIVYYCEPYASYQRGSNENINGLIRRTFKKGTNFNLVSDKEIKKIQDIINSMPRKMFNFYSSSDIYLMYKK